MRSLALVGALALAIAACGGDNSSSTTTVTATATTAGVTTTAPQSTTTAPETTTTATGPCAPPPVPATAVAENQVTADFDGDGAPDTLTTYGTGTASDPAPWHIRLDRAAGGSVDDVIPDAASGGDVRPLGGAEVSQQTGLAPDGSGVEAFVEVGSGASDALVGVFQYQDCALVRLSGPGSPDPAEFPVGGTVTHLDGLRCDGISGGQRLVTLSATSSDGATYATSDQLLEIAGGAFTTPVAPVTGSLAASDPSLSAYSTLDCAGITAP